MNGDDAMTYWYAYWDRLHLLSPDEEYSRDFLICAEVCINHVLVLIVMLR